MQHHTVHQRLISGPLIPVLLALFVLLSTGIPLSAQIAEEEIVVPEYDLGDQYFTISLGPIIPLFFRNPELVGSGDSFGETNLRAGGIGSLSWHGYINNRWSFGGKLAGAFMNSVNNRTLYMVPITAHASYLFSSFPFEFPIHMGAGINFTSLDGRTYFGTILQPGASFYWRATEDWAFGVDGTYWWVPQFYRDSNENTPPASDTRFGNFLELSLGARYSF